MGAIAITAEIMVQNPFPGLRPFDAKDSTLFFGRDDQTGEALDRLLRQRLLAVVGVSGCGKSSLVGAGMVPALEMGLAGDPEQRWRVATMRPGDGPLRELGRCLGFGAEALAERTYGLLEAVETHLPPGENLLLVVDQFEEIFPFRDRKLHEGAGSEADLFVNYLLRAAQDQTGRVFVLLTMRSDYLGECAKFHGLPEALNDGQYLVPRMTRQQLQEAIEGPLAAVDVKIHPSVVQDLLNQCDEEPDNLPLLQHLLRRMFEKWQEGGARGSITAAMAGNVGGLTDALDQDAETVYRGLSTDEQRAVEVLFRRITESRRADREGVDDRPVRRPQTVGNLSGLAKVSESVLRDIVRRYEERGLLVMRKTDEGDKVDLPHECLCLKWQRLKDWIRSEAEDAKTLRYLLDSVGKNYLTGLALREALEWQNNGRLDTEWSLRYLNGEQRSRVVAWVRESRERVEEAAENERRQAEERSRRAWLIVAVFGVAFLIATAFGVYAYLQKSEADWQRARAEEQGRIAEGQAIEARKQRKIAEDQSATSAKLAKEEKSQRGVAEEQKELAESARREAERQAAVARLGRLVNTALVKKETRPDLAALLSIQARSIADTSDARNSLLSSLEANQSLITVLNSGSVNGVAFSPDGKMLASANDDGTVRLWNVINHQPLGAPLKGHSGSVHSVAFSPDGKTLASAGADRTMQLWDVVSGQPRGAPLRGHSSDVNSVVFSPDGKMLASASWDDTVRLWDVARRQLLGDPLMGHSRDVMGVAFSPDGKVLASASLDSTVRLWDVARREPLGDPLRDTGMIESVAFSPDGKMLASGTYENVRLWDVARHQHLGDLLKGHSSYVNAIAFSPDGKTLASASADQTVRLWDVARRQFLGDPLNGNCVAVSPDGKTLASASADQTVRLWDAARRQSLGDALGGNHVESVAFSPDGKMLASGSYDDDVRLWDVASRHPVSEPLKGHSKPVWSVAFSPDGKILASASSDETIRLWQVASRQPLGDPLRGHSGLVRLVAFSPDGKMLASASDDGTVRLWDVVSRRPLGDPLRGHSSRVTTVAFSPDGKMLASGSYDDTVRFWDVVRRKQLGKPLTLPFTGVLSVAFSPDGRMLASGSYDNTVRLWDVAGRQQLGEALKGHFELVTSVAFSPNGKMLASASYDKMVRLWDVASREPLGDPLKSHTGFVDSVAFSPDGKLLASGGTDTVWLWDIDPNSWAARLCRIANRNLSMAEWRQYIGLNVPYRRTCPDLLPGEGAPTR